MQIAIICWFVEEPLASATKVTDVYYECTGGNMKRLVLFITLCTATLILLLSAPGASAFNCTDCHASLTEGTVVHAPVYNGWCYMCHDSVNASDIPHTIDSKTKFGLTYEGSALCFGCHEQAEVTGNPVHSSIGSMACVDCHNPHASDNAKLIR